MDRAVKELRFVQCVLTAWVFGAEATFGSFVIRADANRRSWSPSLFMVIREITEGACRKLCRKGTTCWE